MRRCIAERIEVDAELTDVGRTEDVRRSRRRRDLESRLASALGGPQRNRQPLGARTPQSHRSEYSATGRDRDRLGTLNEARETRQGGDQPSAAASVAGVAEFWARPTVCVATGDVRAQR